MVIEKSAKEEPSSAAGVKITKGFAAFRSHKIHHNYLNGIWSTEEALARAEVIVERLGECDRHPHDDEEGEKE